LQKLQMLVSPAFFRDGDHKDQFGVSSVKTLPVDARTFDAECYTRLLDGVRLPVRDRDVDAAPQLSPLIRGS
jgi:hypothetical protein